MVRLRLRDGQIAVAPSDAMGGRGASIHPRALCVAGAFKPGMLARAFKRPVVPVMSPAAFLEQLTVASRNRKLGTP